MKKIISSIVLVPLIILSAPDNKLMSEIHEQHNEIPVASNIYDIETGLKESEKKNYEVAIDFIKAHEGYAEGNAYTCVSGNLTIGYGHVIKDGEVFPEHISKKTADSLLRADFKKAFSLANALYPEMHGSRKMAVTHFIFSKGIGAFINSGLKNKIDSNENVDEEFNKWCYYTDYKSGKKLYSKVAAGIQKWEREMWHQDDLMYTKDEITRRKF